MSEKKYGNFLTVILVISIIALLGLGGYFIYDMISRDNTNKQAEAAFDEFQRKVEELNRQKQLANKVSTNIVEPINTEEPIEDDNQNSNGETGNGGNASGGGNSYTNNNYNLQSKYQGYTMLGTIQIPKINIKVPILKEVSVDALNKATCLIYGNINEEGNAVVIGHNNRNGTFFSNLKRMVNGDTIIITDYNGNTINYEVYSVFQATPDDVSFYNRNTNGLREITLSTCTDNDDTKRIIVLAREY